VILHVKYFPPSFLAFRSKYHSISAETIQLTSSLQAAIGRSGSAEESTDKMKEEIKTASILCNEWQ